MKLCLVLLGAVCAPVPALAAMQSTKPLTPNDPVQALPQAAPTQPSTPITPPPSAAPTQPGAEGELRFVFRQARFEGAKAVPEAMLQPAWSKFVGRSVTLAELRAIAAEAEAIYARQGRPFVAVTVPPQAVNDGIVRFTVTEGRISDLTVLGADPAARKQATAVLSPLVDKPALSSAEVEAAYEQSRNVPGLNIAGALRRGSQPGGMDLVVQAEKRSWRVYGNVNNLYAKPVGPGGALLGVDYFGDSRFGDQTSAQIFTTLDIGEQWVARLSHARRLNAQGTTVTVTGLVARAEPTGAVALLDLATEVDAGRLEISQPLWLSLNGSLIASAALDVSDQRTLVFSDVRVGNDRLRVFSAALNGEIKNGPNRLAYGLEFRKGAGFLNASEKGDVELSRLDADPEAFVTRFRLDGQAQPFPLLQLAARVEGQYSRDSVAAPEEFTVGNLTIGRGYEPGSSFGDSAVGAAMEVRVGPFPIRTVRAQPFGFLDVVKVWNREVGAPNDHLITSAGAGVRFELPGRLRLDVVYAVPMSEPLGLGESKPTPRLFANLTVGFDGAFDAMRKLFRSRSKT